MWSTIGIPHNSNLIHLATLQERQFQKKKTSLISNSQLMVLFSRLSSVSRFHLNSWFHLPPFPPSPSPLFPGTFCFQTFFVYCVCYCAPFGSCRRNKCAHNRNGAPAFTFTFTPCFRRFHCPSLKAHGFFHEPTATIQSILISRPSLPVPVDAIGALAGTTSATTATPPRSLDESS